MGARNEIRIQLVRHKYGYFFAYFWSLLIILLISCYLISRLFGVRFSTPWSDSSTYVDYTSKYAAMTAAWITVIGISVGESKVTALITDWLSRKTQSLLLAATLAFNSTFLIVVNFTWFTKITCDSLVSKVSFGMPGIGFSLAAIATPYLFVALAQGNPDKETLEDRRNYLTEETKFLEKLCREHELYSYTPRGGGEKSSTRPKHILLKILAAVEIFALLTVPIGIILAIFSATIFQLPALYRAWGVLSLFVGLCALIYLVLWFTIRRLWVQYRIQQAIDFELEFPRTRRSKIVRILRSQKENTSQHAAPDNLIKKLSYGITLRTLFYGPVIYAATLLSIHVFFYNIQELTVVKSYFGGNVVRIFTAAFLSLFSVATAAEILGTYSLVRNDMHIKALFKSFKIIEFVNYFNNWTARSVSQSTSNRLKENKKDIETLIRLKKLSERYQQAPTDEKSQADEIPPANGLPQDEGGEEDGDEHTEAYSWGVGEYESEDGCDGFREGV